MSNKNQSKTTIKDLFEDLQLQMIAKLKTTRRNITHPGALGDATELNWIDTFREYLPRRYNVDKAFVIDSKNSISDQIDIVIYDNLYSPLMFKQESIIYIPAESVYAVFEVKQDLNKENVTYTKNKIKSVRNLFRTSAAIIDRGESYKPRSHFDIIGGILTSNSTWADPLGNYFMNSLVTRDDNEKINLGCVLNSGSFLVNHANGSIKLRTSHESNALITFFISLWKSLQCRGTAPAIDFSHYSKFI